jgi:hypothetical protein
MRPQSAYVPVEGGAEELNNDENVQSIAHEKRDYHGKEERYPGKRFGKH